MWSFLLNSYVLISTVGSRFLVSDKKADVESFLEVEMAN